MKIKTSVACGLALVGAGCRLLSTDRVVLLPAGDIVLTETRLVTAADSGTVFRGARDGSTRVTAGVALTGWTDRGGGVWAVRLPRDAAGRPLYTETLFVNGRRATRARYPDTGYFNVTGMVQSASADSPFGYRNAIAPPDGALRVLAASAPADLANAQLVVHERWDCARHPIVSFDGRWVVTCGARHQGWNQWLYSDLYFLENLRTAFDAPGEWYYDGAAGEILYRPLPGETIREAVVPRDGLETLVAVKGATDVAFENVTFAHTSPVATKGPTSLPSWQAAARVSQAAVIVDDSTNVVFRNCRFEKLGSYAIWFRSGVKGGGARSCEMTDLGAGGVRLGLIERPDKPKSKTVLGPDCNNVAYVETAPWMVSGVTVDDCLIAHGGRFHPAGVGVFLTFASDCAVTHNDIFDLYYTGVSVGWEWGYAGSPSQRNTIAFNHIRDIGQGELADMGGVYTLGTSFGTCVSNNVIHAIHTASYGGWGLYPDEGSEGIVFENNLVYETDDASFHQHYGKDNVFRNNILVDSAKGQIAVTRAEKHRSLTCARNIILWTKGDAFSSAYGGTKSEKTKIDWRGNLWWRTDGRDVFNGTSFKEWCARVKDEGSVFADPLFADWKARDFTLKPGSPAFRVGFRPFDPRKAGRRRGSGL